MILPPGTIDHLVGRDLDAEAAVDVGGDRLAERLDAGRRRIAVMAVAERLDRRLDDVVGRAEVGLADAEIDDVAALRLKLGGARQHGKGVLLADAVETRNRVKHDAVPPERHVDLAATLGA